MVYGRCSGQGQGIPRIRRADSPSVQDNKEEKAGRHHETLTFESSEGMGRRGASIHNPSRS